MDAPFTAYLDTPNKSPRQNVGRRGVVLHHGALTSLNYLRQLAMGAKQVSATGICKDRDFERLMADGWRPWSLSDAYWDSALRSVETANESTAGWTISDESHWSLARGVAYWARLDGFWPHRDGGPKTWTVIGHREVYSIHGGSYATACPGGMDLNLVVARAQQLLNSPAEPVIDYALLRRQKEDDMYVRGVTNPQVYATYTDANGKPRMRVCGKAESAIANAGGLVLTFGDDASLLMLAEECGYVPGGANPLPVVKTQ